MTTNKRMTNMKNFLAAACMAVMAVSCCGSKDAASVSALDGKWKITEVEGEPASAIKSENEAYIGFNAKDKLVFGCTGCNRLTGALNADSKTGTIDFSALGSTRMMCRDMDMEQKVLGALSKVSKFSLRGKSKLNLTDKDGNTVIKLERRNGK